MWRDLRWLGIPRSIGLDQWSLDERGIKNADGLVHTWRLLWWYLKNTVKTISNQLWWTYDSWERDRGTAVCPGCGARNFDID
jgi:hypothetical protein